MHLVFDIICDPNIVISLLEKRINLCLKPNILSLKNLFEISNGSLTKMIEGFYSIIVRHIDYCKVSRVIVASPSRVAKRGGKSAKYVSPSELCTHLTLRMSPTAKNASISTIGCALSNRIVPIA
jgi:hypothetical protein